MSSPFSRELDALPSLGLQLVRAAVARKPARAAEVPRLELRVRHVVAEPPRLSRYRAVCGFEADGFLPASFPQVLAMPLHMALLNRPEFPYRLLGLIHVRNVIRQFRRLPEGAPLAISCVLEGQREVRLGRELDLSTRVESEGVLAWESVTTMLRRLPGAGEASRKARTAPEEDGRFRDSRPARWTVPADMGRRYAQASGDYNPIHLSTLSARPFGFPRAIAHGMWTLSRCLAEMGEAGEVPSLTLTCEFRRPLFLGSQVQFQTARQEGDVAFRVSSDEATVHLVGALAPA
ncbi:MaoC family dehydratase [Stigmatella aurantiaca]|uniref:MaoC domain protein n=1 Tax=Stigmatella aurantiaca (strain DW4/3-1) TaxID=378806 RepID=Q098N5_STIAD|nr:MaoC/PaaZ C-terminal domain-containing protein [Stigmatella aurantiaca]ADO74155.1 MaoC domain protein [Stigmatella aurantiaca DW4/3-1]EAU68202.1 MaoC domain protein [Stigmatella aurantiaca DW4/3-1]